MTQRRSEALCARCQPLCNFFLSSQTGNIWENCKLSTTATEIALEIIQELKFFSKWVRSQTVAGKSGKVNTLNTPGHPQKHLHHHTQTWSTSACQTDDWQVFTKGCFQDSAILLFIHVLPINFLCISPSLIQVNILQQWVNAVDPMWCEQDTAKITSWIKNLNMRQSSSNLYKKSKLTQPPRHTTNLQIQADLHELNSKTVPAQSTESAQIKTN